MLVKKLFPYLSAVLIFAAGYVLRISYTFSDRAAWSYIISGVNDSAWENYKPFGIAYIFFIIIELSSLRPRLMHFVCARLLGMYVLCSCTVILNMIFSRFFPGITELSLVAAAIGIIFAQLVSYTLYKSSFYVEAFRIPLILSLFAMVFMLIVLSFYPPEWEIFYDFTAGKYGR